MMITNVTSLIFFLKKGTFVDIKKGEVEQEQVNSI